MALTHNSTLAQNEPDWGSVDKTKLPRNAFADVGQADQKSTWGYPHHWVENGGNTDDMGVFTTGTMYLHRGGLNAAWAAAQGAHTGQKASAEVIAHLEAHREAIGMMDQGGEGEQDQPGQNAYRVPERRYLLATELRVSTGPNDNIMIRGHAAVFNQLSETLGGGLMSFRERIMPGTFADTIKADDVRSLFNHDPNYVLGRTRAGTLKLWEDEQGLAIENTLPDTQFARDLAKSMQRGDINQMSFGFQTLTDNWVLEDGVDVRELKKVRLFDVSPVTFPAYPQTDVAVRSLTAARSGRNPSQSEQERMAAEAKHIDEFLAAHREPPDPLSLPELLKKFRP